MTTRRQLRSGFCALVALGLVTTAVPVHPAGSHQPAAVGFTDGEWVGSFSYLGSAELGGVPVRYRSTGTFGLVSSAGGTTGLWDLYVSTLIEGGVATGAAGGPLEGDDIVTATLELDSVTATDALTGMEITFTADELPEAGAGMIVADSTSCNALSGRWEIPFSGTVLEGSFVANRTVGDSAGPAWQRFQQAGLDLLTRIDDGEVPVNEIRAYLREAELIMGDTTERDESCDAETFFRFNTAALALGDAMVIAVGSRVGDLTDDELIEMTRMGWRSGAFLTPEAAFPYEAELDGRMVAPIAAEDLEAMLYWLPVAREFGRDSIAEALEQAIEDARA